LLALVLSCLLASTLNAQDVPKLEIGIQVTALNLGDFKLAMPDLSESQRGVGGRITANLSDNLSVEGEFNTFPSGFRITIPQLSQVVQRKLSRDRVNQILLGVKYGKHFEHIGIFGKFRPGFVSGEVKDETTGNTNPALNTLFRTSTGFALDWGVVLEFYPSKHTMVRLDLAWIPTGLF
jgi:hypothetical protein